MFAHLLTSMTEATAAYDAAIADAERALEDAKRAYDTKVAEAHRAHKAAWQALQYPTTPPSV